MIPKIIVALFFLLLCIAVSTTHAVRFEDVSVAAGMKRPVHRRKKYGGASVADLNGDGFPDLLFTHHDDRWADIYFNNGDGTFAKSSWSYWSDTHAMTPFRFTAAQRTMHFLVSRGGSNGNRPLPPDLFKVMRNRSIVPVVDRQLERYAPGRGRSALPLALGKTQGRIDIAVLNLRLNPSASIVHRYFTVRSSGFLFREATSGFALEPNTYAMATDINGDGRLEVVSFEHLRIYRWFSPFDLRDVSKAVLPSNGVFIGTVAVAELDFDNDGRWDLYVARTNTGDLKWLKKDKWKEVNQRDYLLRNVGGRYVDVSDEARIPQISQTRGVTAGDFNNDGWVDLVLTRYRQRDLLLINRGDGTFRSQDAGLQRASNVRGDIATAVDYDQDGRLDLIVSEGDWLKSYWGGFYRIMKNVGKVDSHILVRVRSSPSLAAVSLYAVVTVKAAGLSMMRRVGSPGTAVSNSYIELLHFGIGKASSADVSIRWTNGEVASRSNVEAGVQVTFGRST